MILQQLESFTTDHALHAWGNIADEKDRDLASGPAVAEGLFYNLWASTKPEGNRSK